MAEKKRRCNYCGSQERKLTREHVISKSVLRVAFGESIENVVLQPAPMGGQTLCDQETQIKDVCGDCNQALSPYDEAGVELMKAIYPHHDATGITLPFSHNTLGWLLKTHLNEMRITPNENFAQPRAKSAIYRALVQQREVSLDWYQLFIEGWQGAREWWEKNSSKSIQYFTYKGVRDEATDIYISNFRMAWLDTFLLLPMDGSYRRFSSRCEETRKHVTETYGFNWQRVNTSQGKMNGALTVVNVAPQTLLERSISSFKPIQQASRWT